MIVASTLKLGPSVYWVRPELCQNAFFPEKMVKGIFVYVLEFMLTFDKIPVLKCAKMSKSEGRVF